MTDRIKALVTGGGGFLGSAVVRLLVDQGAIVRSYSRKSHPALEAMGVEQIQGDLCDLPSVHHACEDMDVVFHTAAKAGTGGTYRSFYETNVQGTRNIIRACNACGVSRMVYTSSPSVIFHRGDLAGVDESVPYPATYLAHYPQTKAMAEKLVVAAAKQGLPAVVLRPHLIWGPGDNHLLPRLLSKGTRLRQVGNGKNLVDTIYIDNAASAHILADHALKNDPTLSGNIYFLSQDDPVPAWEMINRLLAAAGKPPVRKKISPALAGRIGWICEGVYRILKLDSEPPMTRFVAEELATAHWFNISAAKADLGYKPYVSTEEGLARLTQWLNKAH